MILSGIAIGTKDSIYFTNSQGSLFCLRDDGDIATLVWSVSLGNFSYNHFSSPAVTLDNTVFVCMSGFLQAVDGYTGTLKWKVAVACDESGPVIHSNGTVYATQGYGQIFAFDGSILNGRWLIGPFV
jgi:outer membrane protein assembly factor BamB